MPDTLNIPFGTTQEFEDWMEWTKERKAPANMTDPKILEKTIKAQLDRDRRDNG